MKPLADITIGPVLKLRDGWGFFVYPPLGGDCWVGDYHTREAARKARRETRTEGTGAQAEYLLRVALR